MRSVRRVERTWEHLGRRNPMWAVLTNREEWDEERFFETGEQEIVEVLDYTEQLGIAVGRDRALDFGCGLGRLSRALSGRFREVIGVDIAASMVAEAERLNAAYANCRFIRNNRPDLAQLESGSFDFAYSNITLQHMPWSSASAYLGELVRILRRDGVLVFQLPTGAREEHRPPGGLAGLPRRMRSAAGLLVRLGRRKMEMHCAPREQVEQVLAAAGGVVVDAKPDQSAGSAWEGLRYTVLRGTRSTTVA